MFLENQEENMEPTLAIDFGTTNTLAFIVTNNGIEPAFLDVSNDGKQTQIIRTAIFFDNDGPVYFGNEAMNRYHEDPTAGRFLRSIKSILPMSSFTHTEICGRKRTSEEIVSAILRHVKNVAEAQSHLIFRRAIFGRPVIFAGDGGDADLAVKRLSRAASLAGFEDVAFELEPIAAARAFIAPDDISIKPGEVFFIGDFGGGTSDFAIVKRNNYSDTNSGTRGFKILSVGGVYVGGDTFDSRLVWHEFGGLFGKDVKYKTFEGKWTPLPSHLVRNISQWHLIPLLRERRTREFIREVRYHADDREAIARLERLIDENYAYQLFKAVENLKCRLSDSEEEELIFDYDDFSIYDRLSRSRFEQLIETDIQRILDCIIEVVAKSGVSEKDIFAVFVTGGSGQVPAIQKALQEIFPRSPLRIGDSFNSVAYGLGLLSSVK